MYCSNCGSEIKTENAVVCLNCGCQINKAEKGMTNIGDGILIAGYITMIFPAIVGLIIGIVILSKGNESQKKHGIVITIVSGINMIIGLAMMSGG